MTIWCATVVHHHDDYKLRHTDRWENSSEIYFNNLKNAINYLREKLSYELSDIYTSKEDKPKYVKALTQIVNAMTVGDLEECCRTIFKGEYCEQTIEVNLSTVEVTTQKYHPLVLSTMLLNRYSDSEEDEKSTAEDCVDETITKS